MRGFCTIATGSVEYSRLAYNLLLSYRRFTNSDYPFAVLTDKRNELLDQFDKVVLLNQSHHSFMDKIELFNNIPYEETIFIDADSLAYGDLTNLFSFFENADDVSCPGKVLPRDSTGGWFRVEDSLEYQKLINYSIAMHGGIYFIRRTNRVQEFYKTCIEIVPRYKDIFKRFQYLTEPADEPIVALAMAIHGFQPVMAPPEMMAFYRDAHIYQIDIVSGTLEYSVASGKTNHGLLLHWATDNTRKYLYKREASKLNKLGNMQYGKEKQSIWDKMMWTCYRIVRKVRRMGLG